MSQNAKHAIIVAAALMAFMAIVPPEVFGCTDSPLWKFIDKYQTLITGIAAVLGAYATIRQMRKTDAGSEERHQELVELSLRADKLKVARLYQPQFNEMNEHLANIINLRASLVDFSKEELDYAAFKREEQTIHEVMGRLQQTLNRPTWDETSPLFDGWMTHSLEKLRGSIREMAFELTSASNARGNVEQRRVDRNEGILIDIPGSSAFDLTPIFLKDLEKSYYRVQSLLIEISDLTTEVNGQLMSLAKQYRVR